MAKTVGMVGIGIMGSAMAKHLIAAGFPVVGRDVDRSRVEAFAAMGGTTAASPRAVAEAADVVILSLPSIAAFDEVVDGADGLASAAKRGLIVIETSTLPVEVKERARDVLAGKGITLLDTPLSGTGAQAAVKDLVVYASGETAAIADCADVFAGFSRAHYDVGAFGNGSRMKFVANLLVAIHNVAAAEAMVLGIKAGLDPAKVLEVVSDGAGTSRMFEVRGPMMVESRYDEATMSVGLWQKDMKVIGEFATALGCALPLFAASGQIYNAAIAQGHAGEDTAAVCAVLERMAGIGRSSSGK